MQVLVQSAANLPGVPNDMERELCINDAGSNRKVVQVEKVFKNTNICFIIHFLNYLFSHKAV